MADGAAAAAAAADPAVAPSSRRRVCDGCDRPASVCLCDALPASPLPTRGALVVLQHPTEHKRPKGTGWILPRCVARCVVSRGRRPSPSLRRMLERVLPKRAPVYLLYPLDEAADVDAVDLVAVGAGSTQIEEEEEEEEEADDGDGDATTPSTSTTTEEDEAVADALRDAAYVCVVIDATWKQAREMFHETTSRLPRRAKVVKLPPPPPPPPPPWPPWPPWPPPWPPSHAPPSSMRPRMGQRSAPVRWSTSFMLRLILDPASEITLTHTG